MSISFFYPPQPSRIWPNSSLLTKYSMDKNWDAEIKYNGWRLLVFKQLDGTLQFFNRHSTLIHADTKSLVPALSKIDIMPKGTVFDGELIDKRTKEHKGIIILWDVAFYKGKDIRTLPLIERRKRLDCFDTAPEPSSSSFISLTGQTFRTKQFTSNGTDANFFKSLYDNIDFRNDPLEEGIILKNTKSVYSTHPSRGVDTLDWFKIKKIGDHAKVSKEDLQHIKR